MKNTRILFVFFSLLNFPSYSQVDTTFIYNNDAPYGTLDIRISKSDTRFFYLQEGQTFNFRESAPGVPTNSYTDMTAWDSSPYEQGNLREKVGTEDNFIMNYRLLKPGGYNAGYQKGYPLIILLHGSGERGNCWKSNCHHATSDYNPIDNNPPAPTTPDHELLNNDHNLLHGGKPYLEAVNKAGNLLPDDPSLEEGAFPGFVLFPQNMNGWNGDAVQDAIRIIRLLVKKYNIDEDRIYITGLSNGAHGTFEALKRAPWMFASTIVMSPIDDGFITNVNMESAVAGIPMWVFQGAMDDNPYPRETQSFIKEFRDAGAVIRYTEYPNLGHTTWNTAFKEPEYFSWLLSHTKANVHAFAGTPTICNNSESGLELELASGFKAYQWQKDGQTISGATSSKFKTTSSGTYRGRFSRISASPTEAQWNEWSPGIIVTIQNPPVAEMRQIGTVVLKDLNNGADAHLESVGEFAHYYWYKNGVLLNLPGNEDDTLRSIIVQPGDCSGTCTSTGNYTLVTASFDNCKSAPTAGKYLFFNNQAPVNITAPTEFSGKQVSASSISLTWKDNGNNENGYEIWRRKKLSDTDYTLWEMATLTSANTVTYTDLMLDPSSSYQYKIRGVSNTGRSNYTPSGETESLTVSTAADSEKPTTPLNVKLARTGLEKVKLTWDQATDDSRIANYQVIYNADTIITASTDTTLIISQLAINTNYTFNITAIDQAGNISSPSDNVSIYTGVYGLFYEHSAGGWSSLDSIDYTRPEYTGTIDNFKLSKKIQDDFFYFRFEGYLYINTAGAYFFRTTSDDGSRLYLNGSRIVNNDGIHELLSASSGEKNLTDGPQRITVDFFESIESDSLRVEYKGPDSNNEWQIIPSTALKSTLIVAAEPEVPNEFVVHVYPNPADQFNLNVQVESFGTKLPINVSLIDPMGKQIFSGDYDPEELREGAKLTTYGKLNSGMYFIRVLQGNTIVQQKVVIRN